MLLRSLSVACALALPVVPALADEKPTAPIPTVEAKSSGLQRIDGFVPLLWDEAGGKLYLEIGRFGVESYVDLFRFGGGSNRVDSGVNDQQHVNRLRVDAQLARDDPRYVEQVFNDLSLCSRVSFNDFDRVYRSFTVELTGSKQSRPSHDGVEWCS